MTVLSTAHDPRGPANQPTPTWVPIMKRAEAIVTDHGGRDLSRRSIVSRELDFPRLVGNRQLQPMCCMTSRR